jgi:hypothetical protein
MIGGRRAVEEQMRVDLAQRMGQHIGADAVRGATPGPVLPPICRELLKA